jgi:glycosyltransferase involved in cell wall biosynthesis
VVVSIGRLSTEKGHADLVRALSLVSKIPDVPPFRTIIVGDGPERERLRQLAVQTGIGDRITMTGHQTDVRSYYALASVFALPSHSEGSPNVVLEAMAAGVPVAATAVGGVPEIVEHDRTGLLVPARDPAAMAQAIGRLLRDKSLRRRLGEAGREHARREFTPEAHARSLRLFYWEVLDGYPNVSP